MFALSRAATYLTSVFLTSICFWVANTSAAETLPTVSQIDLDRYTGRWFEISRLPMWFERNCVSDISANYTRRSDGRIDVVNRCHTQNDDISAQGIAETPEASKPGQLRVRFAPDWLAWLPMVWGDYWIIDLDPDYQWVLVGAPSRNYLWILARTPALDIKTVESLKQKAQALGFKTTDMVDVTNSNR